MWSVFRLSSPLPARTAAKVTAEVEALFAELDAGGRRRPRASTTSPGLRADADLMVWWHAEDIADGSRSAYHRLRRTAFGAHLTRCGRSAALHRPAEFNKSHVPAFLAGEEPEDVHLRLPVRALLRVVPARGHGAARHAGRARAEARGYPDVRANTVASFALGDYEWMLAFEADELHRIVDLMRHLRASEARRHVREEVPFYTGAARVGARPGRRPALTGPQAAAKGPHAHLRRGPVPACCQLSAGVEPTLMELMQ